MKQMKSADGTTIGGFFWKVLTAAPADFFRKWMAVLPADFFGRLCFQKVS